MRMGKKASCVAIGISTAAFIYGGTVVGASAVTTTRVAATSPGKFVPYWTSKDSCAVPVAAGFTSSGTINCLGGANGTAWGVWYQAGASVSYTFKVQSGQVAYITYGIPAGDWLNSANVTVQIDKRTPKVITKDKGPFDSTCTSPSPCLLWTSARLPAGKHTLLISADGSNANVYGVWIKRQAASGI